MTSKIKFDSLVEEALENAKKDRQLALEAYEGVKDIYNGIDKDNAETLQAVLLIGANTVKLIEQSSRSNEQIIKIAQLKEKEQRNKEEDDEEKMTFTLEDIKKVASENG